MLDGLLKLIYYLGRMTGRYTNFIADYPDNKPPTFRYPHLKSVGNYFNYNSSIDCFTLKDKADSRLVANKIMANEITLYELVNTKAKRIHLNDFLGYKTSGMEKLSALLSVTGDYYKNKWLLSSGKNSFGLDFDLAPISRKDFMISDDFHSLEEFLGNFSKTEVIFVRLKGLKRIFQIGVTLKGTNFVFVDSYLSTMLQELYHVNFHFAETIRGFKKDNKNIVETWANVPWLYLMQQAFGRIERRLRKNKSPHDIKFIDYVFWRAYLGQGFRLKSTPKQKLAYHGIYGLIAPTANLLFNSLSRDTREKNDLIIRAIFTGAAPTIKEQLNRSLKGDYFEKIYHNFNLFNRLGVIDEIIVKEKLDRNKIYKILFNPKELVPTLLDHKLVALIWLSGKINQNKKLIINLLEDFCNEQLINQGGKMTIKLWLNYLNKINKHWAAEVATEYDKNKEIINSL